MTKLVLLFEQTEGTMDIVADYTLETTVILLTNPQISAVLSIRWWKVPCL